jgi:serine phosphatase RsbU (regulator of sigma subunit)
MVLGGLVLVHAMFKRRPAWSTWVVAAAGLGYVAWVWSWNAFRPGVIGQIFFIVAFLEMLRVSVAALLRREKDAWIVAAAFVPLAVVAIVNMIAQIVGWPLNLRFVPDFTLVVVALALSVFISRRAARTARELEIRLKEVRELSDRAVEQERRAIHEESERRILEAEKKQRSEELEAARRLQLAMLPQDVPQIPNIDLSYRMLTATEVGGDYVDLRMGDDGRALLAVGDATSHGLQAGMVVAVAKSIFQGVDPHDTPTEVLHRIGDGLQTMRERYASMAMLVVAVDKYQLRVASAGMPPLLIRRKSDGAIEELMMPGVPLGTLSDVDYPVRELDVAPGDVVLAMSDGVAEAQTPDGEHFGYERVSSFLRSCEGETAKAIVNDLLSSVTAFVGSDSLSDDVTLLALVMH